MRELPLENVTVQELQDEFEVVFRPYLEKRPEPGYWYMHSIKELTPPFQLATKQLGMTFSKALVVGTEAGYGVHTHTDGSQDKLMSYYRWHLPIYAEGTLAIIDGKTTVMREGFWYGRFKNWLPHSMENPSDRERMHLVVDFVCE